MKAERGFTLIELLIALAIVGITLGLLSSSLRVSANTADTVENRLADAESVAMVHRLVRGQLQRAVPVPIIEDDTVMDIEFGGDATSVDFVTAIDNRGAPTGYSIVSLWLERDPAYDDGRLRLVGSWRPRLDAAAGSSDDAEQAATRVLIGGLEWAEFSYAGRGRQAAAGWQTEWRNRGELPAMVRLTLTTIDGRVLPDVVVAPQLALPQWRMVP